MLSLYTITVYCVDQTTTQFQTGSFWKLSRPGRNWKPRGCELFHNMTQKGKGFRPSPV
nr:MAG TPA: hypothetical protein [Caudoviricetes sp.]